MAQEISCRESPCLRTGRCATIRHRRYGQIGSTAFPGLTFCWISNCPHKGHHLGRKIYRSRASGRLVYTPSIYFLAYIAPLRISPMRLFCLKIIGGRPVMVFGSFGKELTWYSEDLGIRPLKEEIFGFVENRAVVYGCLEWVRPWARSESHFGVENDPGNYSRMV